MVATRGMARPQRLLGMAFGTAFLLSPIQIENLISPFNLQWAICPLFILAAIVALMHLPKAASPGGQVAVSLLVVVAACAGIYSSLNGLAGAVIVAALVSLSPIGRVLKISLIASIGLSIVVFFIGYELQVNDDLRADLLTPTGFWQFLATIPNILGAPMEKLGEGGGLGLGAVGLAAWIAASPSMLRRYRREGKLDPAIVVLWALSAMAIATAIMIAYGRSGQGVYIASRYDTWSAIFWVAILGMFWRLFEDRAPAVLGIGALLLTMSYVTGQGYAGTFRGRAELLDELTAELRSGGTPDNLRLIYPDMQGFERRIEFLRPIEAFDLRQLDDGSRDAGARGGCDIRSSRTERRRQGLLFFGRPNDVASADEDETRTAARRTQQHPSRRLERGISIRLSEARLPRSMRTHRGKYEPRLPGGPPRRRTSARVSFVWRT